MIAGRPIACSRRTIAVSTMDAKVMAAFGAIQELIWTKGVLGEISFDYVDPMIMHMIAKVQWRSR
jgi:hypothetical protein